MNRKTPGENAKHYFDEAKAVELLNGLKTGKSVLADLYAVVNPVIRGVVNRKAFCEDFETRRDLVNDVWAGILRYKLLDKWAPGKHRAFSYISGISQRTLFFVLGDRNKRQKKLGAPKHMTVLEDLESMAAEIQPNGGRQGQLEAILLAKIPEFSSLIVELLRSKAVDEATFKENCKRKGFDEVLTGQFIIKLKEAKEMILGGLEL